MSRHNLALAQESCRGHGTFSPLLSLVPRPSHPSVCRLQY